MLKHLALFGSFLLLTGCNNSDPGALQARIAELETTNEQLQRELAAASPSASDREAQQHVLEPALYFPSGSAWLTARARRALDALAATLREQHADHDFYIRGYTDDVPIGQRLREVYPSNWYLSAQRAAAVAHYLDTEHQIRSRTLEIAAYGPQRPTASNETTEGRQQNRRVVIVVDATPSGD